jgi:uncharacterized SAM-binding protein YcdF (DUF218 family)
MKRNIRRFFVKILSICSILVILDLILAATYIFVLLSFTNNTTVTNEYDVGVIFNYGYSAKNGHTVENRERIKFIWHLFEEKVVKNVICVGGFNPRYNFLPSRKLCDSLVQLGVPQDHIWYDSASHDTYTNWEEARKIIQRNNWKNILLTSSPPQLFRLSRIVKEKEMHISYASFSFHDYLRLYGCLGFWREMNIELFKLVCLLLPQEIYRILVSIKHYIGM